MRRVPGNMVGPLLLLWGVGATGWSLRSEWVNVQVGTVATTAFGVVFFCISCPAAILLLLLFPDGKPYPSRLARWLPPLTGLLVVAGMFYLFGYYAPDSPGNIPNPLYIPSLRGAGLMVYLAAFLVGMVIALVTLVLRYRSGDERLRLQIRWLAWLLGVGILLGVIPFERLIGQPVALWFVLFTFIFWQSFLAVGIGVAVLRHNLWGVDVVIRKTLVYTVLTALLALVYFGSVVLLQALFGRLVGVEQSTLAVVVSTLVIAALFTTLRRRVQDTIDRRFFRKKYNAQQVLARFAQTARDETDLDALLAELVRVVDETLQPEHVSVWLRETKSPKGS
jgi:low affinity Fe/Cu permease